jgi:hypothetical protein
LHGWYFRILLTWSQNHDITTSGLVAGISPISQVLDELNIEIGMPMAREDLNSTPFTVLKVEQFTSIDDMFGRRLKSLSATIAQIYRLLREVYWDNDFDMLVQRIAEDCNDHDYVHELNSKGLFGTKNFGMQIQFATALSLSILAQKAYENGRIEDAWSLIAEASLDAGSVEYYWLTEQESARARENDEGDNKPHGKSDLVKKEIIRLLVLKMTGVRWKTTTAAVQAILPDLDVFVRKDASRYGLDPDNLFDRVYTWSSDDEAVCKAFNNCVSEKKRFAHLLKYPEI